MSSMQKLQVEKDSFHARSMQMVEFILSPGFEKLGPEMQDVIKRQLDAMDQYERVLGERIALSGGK